MVVRPPSKTTFSLQTAHVYSCELHFHVNSRVLVDHRCAPRLRPVSHWAWLPSRVTRADEAMSACGRKSQWSISVEFFARKLDLEVDLETGPVQKDSKTPLLASFMV